MNILDNYYNNEVLYKLGENNLPAGISFEEYVVNNQHLIKNKLIGKCLTKESNDWYFTVIAFTNNEDEGVERTFYIRTNPLSDEDKIIWESLNLENAKIGYPYNDFIKASSKTKIKYEIVGGKLPNGLKMNFNGEIYGTADLQDLGEYSFKIRASNSLTFEEKDFTIMVEKGLSENSLETYLYINLENLPEYEEMKSRYDETSTYKNYNENYKVPSIPKIDIATICAYDPILLKYKFNQFNLPINIYWKESK